MKVCPQCRNSYPDDYQSCPRDLTPLPAAAPEIVPGDILRGKYEVLSQIGAGGMATVYKVRHRAFHEIAAVKIVHSHFMHDPAFVKRFRNEAVVARQLKHPNAVRIDDFDYTDDGRPFIVMEFVDGRSLYDMRRSVPGPWPVDRCFTIVSQATEALGAAHTLGIVHRDIKPANIVLLRGPNDQLQVKVLDFGIAKVGAADTFAGMTNVLTQQSLVIGTPEYMSPEQASGRLETAIDGRSDIYSLGLVLYEMLTGAHPFQADTPMGMLIQQLNTQPAPPESIHAVPPAISALVLKSLQKEPADRFQSAADFLTALHNPEAWYVSQSSTRSATPPRPVPQPASPAPVFGQSSWPTAATATPPAAPPRPPQPAPGFAAHPAPATPAAPISSAFRTLETYNAAPNISNEEAPASSNRTKYLVFGGIVAAILLAAGLWIGTRPSPQTTAGAPTQASPPISSSVAATPGGISPPTPIIPTATLPAASPNANNLFQQAVADDKRKDYKDAEKLFQQACDLGDLQGCASLGQYYEDYDGRYGVKADFVKALALFRKSCDGGDAVGCTRAGGVLGGIHVESGGIPVANFPSSYRAQSAAFYVKGCDGGDAEGCGVLGYLYESGIGVPTDLQESATLLRKGCSLGYHSACDNLKNSDFQQTTASAPATAPTPDLLHAPTKIPKDIKMIQETSAPPTNNGVAGMSGMGVGGNSAGALATSPVVHAVPAGAARLSSGIVAGMVIFQPGPVYPPIAKAAHVQGVVVLHAIISKQGTIESLDVVSGPPMLRSSAVEAVKQWRYHPYILNGQPTEVETTIKINFTFGGSTAAPSPNPGPATP